MQTQIAGKQLYLTPCLGNGLEVIRQSKEQLGYLLPVARVQH